MATVVEAGSLLKDAALIVDVCFSVEEGDTVTIICDDDREEEAKAVAEVVLERGGWPVVMNNEMQVRRGRAASSASPRARAGPRSRRRSRCRAASSREPGACLRAQPSRPAPASWRA